MKLILEIDTETEKNTDSGDCPCCYWKAAKDEEEYWCNVTKDNCAGIFSNRPDNCPLKEAT